MTAQVGVLNRKAVVLATDSAVTIQSSNANKKIYNSVNKLFALSKSKSIAMMIYGNANLLETPWETISKIYRKERKIEFKKLDDCATDFFNWLEKNSSKFFPKSIQIKFIKDSINAYLYAELVKPTSEKISEMSKEGSMDQNEIKNYLKQQISETYELLNKKSFTSHFDTKTHNAFIKRHKNIIDAIIKELFKEVNLSKPNIKKIEMISGMVLTKEIFSDPYSGVVFAGFGDEEIYPSLMEFKVQGVFDNTIKFKKTNEIKIESDGTTAQIVPFAQDDVIRNFMDGIHPDILKFLNVVFKLYPTRILEQTGFKGQKKKDLRKKLNMTSQAIYQICKDKTEEFSMPVVQMVSMMPITEMCELAEALVNLTSLRKKMTMQAETVGGETEVLSITKGEGLIWIKRKHYFDPKLNHSFFTNYLNI